MYAEARHQGLLGQMAQEDNNMMDRDRMMGIQRPDMNELKEVKVKIPVKQLLRLHYLKLTGGRTFSDVVSEALTDYFQEQEAAKEASS